MSEKEKKKVTKKSKSSDAKEKKKRESRPKKGLSQKVGEKVIEKGATEVTKGGHYFKFNNDWPFFMSYL